MSALMTRIAKGLCLTAAVTTLPLSAPSFAQSDPASFADQLRPRVWIGDAQERYSLDERMAAYDVPGVAVAIIEDGEVVFASGFGVRQYGSTDPVDADTVFSAGSVSKVATASLVLSLAHAGALDLDAPVATQLESWSLPDYPEFEEDRITLRTILSHTSGFNMHGFRDFQPGDDLPTTIQTLEGQSPAVNDPLTLLSEPGTAYRYSGGGYTLAQQIVDDTDPAADFDTIANTHLLTPLGMTRSTFTNPLSPDHGNIAMAHNRDGAPVALPRGYEAFPESAASGLWTSANDLASLVAALLDSYRDEDGFLPRSLAQDMMTPVSPSEHGLGPRIEGRDDGLMFHHGGTNSSYHAWIEGHLATGDGLVILTNGANGNGLITEIRNGVSDAMNWDINAPVRVPEIALSADQLSDYAGWYRVDTDFPHALRRIMVRGLFEQRIHIQTDGERLTLTVGDDDGAIALIPLSPNRFWIEGFGLRLGIAELEFHRDAFGDTQSVTFHLPNASSHYVRDERHAD
ncbi:MAG: serine hydrolase [Oceanicaulis sp.]|nr:serine hydrolase [Oceanicaulis sp.]